MSAERRHAHSNNVPSLFVIALPRSLSSWVHEWARAALGLHAPPWTSAGEILNAERWRMLDGPPEDGRFEHDARSTRFDLWTRFLDDTVRPHGRAYKDVVQPFVCARWLSSPNGRGLRVLRIRRPVADVAWSMLEAGWHYPERAAASSDDQVDRLLSGLLKAQHALAGPQGVDIEFDALAQASEALGEALRTLYPECNAAPIRIEAGFAARFDNVLARRRTPLWRSLDARCRALQDAEGEEQPAPRDEHAPCA